MWTVNGSTWWPRQRAVRVVGDHVDAAGQRRNRPEQETAGIERQGVERRQHAHGTCEREGQQKHLPRPS